MSAGPSKQGDKDLGVPPPPVNRHAPTATELQAMQLAKLLKDPTKDVFIPKPPKEKTLRPPREMMKNVQGSSAGAGSGEFHVYKQNRRREYERIKMMNETAEKEREQEDFEARKREREEAAEAKTSKNRAKRQKKKARKANAGAKEQDGQPGDSSKASSEAPLKKRRLVDGKEMVFRRPGEESDEDGDDDEVGPATGGGLDSGIRSSDPNNEMLETSAKVIEEPKIIIHDD